MSRVRAQANESRLLAEKIRDQYKDKDIHITSLSVPDLGINGGVVFNVTADRAARNITKQTHRLSSKVEVTQYLAQMEKRRSDLAAENERRSINTRVVIGADVMSALRAEQPRTSAAAAKS